MGANVQGICAPAPATAQPDIINIRRVELSEQALNNPQKSGVFSHGEENVAVFESSLLVPLAKIKPKKFALIESLDYFGNDTRSKKIGSSQ
jgi:hypothetical protein